MNHSMSTAKRFQVALSFPGEYRDTVSQIAETLAHQLGQENVFYDAFYTAELARPNLDLYLQDIYRYQSELTVLFIGEDYEKKKWCGLEWKSIRVAIMDKEDSQIMFIRMDDGKVRGVFPFDGYVDGRLYTPLQLANFIVERLAFNRQANPI